MCHLNFATFANSDRASNSFYVCVELCGMFWTNWLSLHRPCPTYQENKIKLLQWVFHLVRGVVLCQGRRKKE